VSSNAPCRLDGWHRVTIENIWWKDEDTLTATFVEAELSSTEQLARFFRDVRPAGVQALLTLSRPGSVTVREAVVVEFASAQKAVFVSRLPLEFEDPVHLENDRGYGIEGKVVAVQYHAGNTAVVVEFLDGPFAWMKMP
jgi:hypothetical protein